MKIYFALKDDGIEMAVGLTKAEALEKLRPQTMIRAAGEEGYTPLAAHPDFTEGPGSVAPLADYPSVPEVPQQGQERLDPYQGSGKKHVVLRVVAFVADYFVYLTFFFVMLLLFGEIDADGRPHLQDLPALIVILAWFVWLPVVEAIRGRTFGKSLLGLTIVTTSGEVPRWPTLLKRRLLDPIEILCCPFFALVVIITSERGQRLGDLWAGTVVVDSSEAGENPERGLGDDREGALEAHQTPSPDA